MTMPMSMPARMAWYRNTAWIASRTTSLPRNENETFETPPLISDVGQLALEPACRLDVGHAVAGVLLDARADGEDVRVDDHVCRIEARLLGQQVEARDARSRPCARRCLPGPARRRPSRSRRRRSAVRAAPGAGTPASPSLSDTRVDDRPALDVLQPFLDHDPTSTSRS